MFQTVSEVNLSLPKTLSGEDSPELWNRGMLAILRLLIGALRDCMYVARAA
jgi:hypothetical protein